MAKPLTILIAEDEALIALGLRRELERAGYVVDQMLATAEAAVERIEQTVPDVILMDIRLAGPMTGLEAARQIRISHPVPIIFMTGYGKDTYEASVDELRPSALIGKPINIFLIKEMIDQFCDGR
jgi:CheY-like chemotaxis protein